ncbi:MAG TPA: hypothetical protein VNL94_00725 [Candidatus Binatia bacterium]|nr:hypothetical protein [Candidatus Binatia bacterium]
MGDAVGNLVQSILDFLEPIILPDWKALVDLFPIFLVLGVVGPLLSLIVLGWVIYFVGKPRGRIPYTPPEPRPAGIVDGRPVYPPGEPYCNVHRLVYPFGSTRCPLDNRDLAVICPKCGTGRPAYVDTCGTCGLVLKIETRTPALRPAGPPPGGAAVA